MRGMRHPKETDDNSKEEALKEGVKKTSTAFTFTNCIEQNIVYRLSRGQRRTKKHLTLVLCLKRKQYLKTFWLG